MPELSADALRVLRDIQTRGLQVMWSFRVPNPYYDDETEMPREDWRIVESVLGHTEHKSEYVITSPRQRFITRESIRNGMHVVEKIVAYPDMPEHVIEFRAENTLYADNAHDQVISEQIEERQDGQWYEYSRWESDYLEVEKIDQDDYTEEFVGILKRYTLTDEAKALLA